MQFVGVAAYDNQRARAEDFVFERGVGEECVRVGTQQLRHGVVGAFGVTCPARVA